MAKKAGYLYEVAPLKPERKAQWENFLRTANAKLENVALDPSEANQSIPLWVHNVQTSYSMIGSRSQGPGNRTFYPRGVAHGNLIITGVAPTPYFYDKLVEFLTTQMTFALDANVDFEGAWVDQNANGTLPIKFTLQGSNGKDQGYHNHKPIQVSGYIPRIEAGATRFQMSREYTLEMIVANNYRETETYTADFNKLMRDYANSVITPTDGTINTPIPQVGKTPR